MKLDQVSAEERRIITRRLGINSKVDDDTLADCLMAELRIEPRRRGTLSESERAEAEAVIEEAIADNKFSPERKDHYLRRWARDPSGTKKLIGRLAPSYAGDGEPESYPAEWVQGRQSNRGPEAPVSQSRVTSEDL